jgi:hypothetical protein
MRRTEKAAPAFHIQNRYYVCDEDQNFRAVSDSWAERLLEHGARNIGKVPSVWQFEEAGVALFAIVLLYRDRRPRYVERCALSLHALEHRKCGNQVVRSWSWEGLAGRLCEDLRIKYTSNERKMLGGYLSWSRDRAFPDDVARFLHDSPWVLHDQWIELLLAGKHTRPLWNLATRTLHPAGVSIGSPESLRAAARSHTR